MLEEIYGEALRAVDPAEALRRHLSFSRGILRAGEVELPVGGRILLLGVGKAGARMAVAAEEILAGSLWAGLVIVKDGHRQGYRSERVEVLEASHPIPDARGHSATRRLMDMALQARADDVVLFLLSGGGSALLVAPAPGLALEDLRQTNTRLLECGATIGEVNCVRKHLSAVKGGHLARAIAPACCLTLVLSDVPGNPLDAIASGPTVADPTSFAEARAVIARHGLEDRLPPAVIQHLRRGEHETPGSSDPVFEYCHTVVIGDNVAFAEAAMEATCRRGHQAHLLTTSLQGEAREVALVLASLAREVRQHDRPFAAPTVLVASGETTVRVRGEGRGGRCQELALAFARTIRGTPGVRLLAGSSDGTDGPTDAAGAVVDGSSWRPAGEDYLQDNDAYGYFRRFGGLLVTGPTGTNVNDLVLLEVERTIIR